MLIPIVLLWLMCWLTGFLLLRRIQHPRGTSGAGVDAARVSIIIPARNEAHNLPRLLRSIRE
ncbi:MAG: glycosyltransferase family 2 protein, partial [Luteolibacter sp.]